MSPSLHVVPPAPPAGLQSLRTPDATYSSCSSEDVGAFSVGLRKRGFRAQGSGTGSEPSGSFSGVPRSSHVQNFEVNPARRRARTAAVALEC